MNSLPATPIFQPGSPPRNAAMDSLRGFIVLLVITHHAVLAYHPYAPPLGAFDAWIGWGAFPVIDAARGKGLDVLALWNDSFFMALMFLLSGLFVGPSLARKGAVRFARDRFVRLGIPFIFAALVIAPLAYLPAYLQRAAATEASGFLDAWFSLTTWPAGPAWFLWILLGFGCIAALVHGVMPGAMKKLGAFGAWCGESPVRAALVLVVAAVIVYLPVTRIVSPLAWFAWGPFFGQTARIGLYATYFCFGIALGARGGIGERLFAPNGRLARQWIVWQVVAGVVFAAFVVALVVFLTKAGRGEPAPVWEIATSGLLAVTSVTTSFSLLAYFARRRSQGSPLWTSLSRNSFAMYVIHYGIVSWMQYGLLPVSLPGLVKALIVTLSAIAVSWAGAAALRRIPGVAHVL